MRQSDVSTRAGVGRWKVVALEGGRLADLKLGEIDRCFAALGARLEVAASWHGAALDRLIDGRHARFVALVVAMLRGLDWIVEIEVSFSEYGERGSIDVFAWQYAESVIGSARPTAKATLS